GLGRGLEVGVAGRVDMREGGVAAPVLGRGVGVDDLRDAAAGAVALQEAVRPLTERVGHLIVGEGECVAKAGRELDRGLGEAVVELAPAGAGDMNKAAIEDLAAGFIDVQAKIEEMA